MDSLASLERRLYAEVYIGHLPDSWWKRLAQWVQDYGHKCYLKGKREGRAEAEGRSTP